MNYRRVLVRGQLIEMWDDPEQPFGCDHGALEGYLRTGKWVLLFNALALPAAPLSSA